MWGPPIIQSPPLCHLSRWLLRIAPLGRDVSDVRHVPKLVFPFAGFSLSGICSVSLVSFYICYGDLRRKGVTLNDKITNAQWLLSVPPGLAFRNSTFYPQSTFMYFVWILEQTAIISLYSINWLVFITEGGCVYSAIRSGCSHVVQVQATTVTLLMSSSTFSYSYYYYLKDERANPGNLLTKWCSPPPI
jgi:hypothetical protein